MPKNTKTETKPENENEAVAMSPADMQDDIDKTSILPLEKNKLYEGMINGMFKLPEKGYEGQDAYFLSIKEEGKEHISRYWSIWDLQKKYAIGEINAGENIRFKRIDNKIVIME